MSLYVRVAVGTGRYLLDAERVLEIAEDTRGAEDAVLWHGVAVPTADLRTLFGETDGAYGSYILVAQDEGNPAALIVDRVDGLVELGDAEFCPLPPIGKVGRLIDAAAMLPAIPHPMLRLRGERALAAPAHC